MPMHDWTRGEPNEFHTFYGRWVYAVCDALNGGLLPPGFYAMADYTLRTVIPDVLTLQCPADGGPAGTGAAAPGVATAPPRTRFAVAEKRKPHART